MATIDKASLSQPRPYDFTESPETDPGFVAPRANYGPAHAFQQAAVEGFENSLTGMSVRALKYWGLKRGAELAAATDGVGVHNQFIDKATFDREYSLDGKLKFDPHYEGKMSLDYAKALQKDAIEDAVGGFRSGLSYAPLASFAGSMVGGLASPIDFAAGVMVPEIQAVKWGLGATAASRAGTGFARVASRTANGAVNGLVNGLAFQLPMMALAQDNQTEYTIQDALNNIALAPIIGGGAGLLHASFKHVGGESDRALANAAMHASLSGDTNILRGMVDNDPRIKAAAAAREEAKARIARDPSSAKETFKFMAGEALPENMTDLQPGRGTKARTAKIIDEILANPQDKRIGVARTNDELFLADAWNKLFGVELKFIDPGFARDLGILGFTKPSTPTVAYISRGELSGSSTSMMFVAAHELGHQVRFRDPALWQSMVGAMMETSKVKTPDMKNGALAEAWRTYVRHANESGVHAGQDLHSKMDETFAHVLGHAMQQQEFWHHMSAAKGASKLAVALSRVHSRLSDLLNHRMTPSTKTLYEGLSLSLAKAKESGVTFDPKGADSQLPAMYAPHKEQFRQLMRNVSQQMNEEGGVRERALAAHMAWEEDAFPQVATFTDESTSRFTTILKNRRIDSGNPGSWLLRNIFANSKPGTPERNAATMFAERVRLDGMDPQTSALSKGPLASFKQNTNGTWDIGIHRNDNYPHWHEMRPENLPERDLMTEVEIRDHIDRLESEFEKTAITAHGEDATIIADEFSAFIHSLTDEELASFAYGEEAYLWNAYADYLDKTIAEHIELVDGDNNVPKVLAEHRKEIDALTSDEGSANYGKFSPENIEKAWAKFREDYPEIQKKLTERKLAMSQQVQGPLAHDVVPAPTREFFEDEFKKARAEVVAQLHEHEESALAIRNFLKGTDEKPTKLSDKMNAAIDEAARDRLRFVWPQYDRVMQIESALKEAKVEEISLETANPSELPASHQDATPLFNTALADQLGEINFMSAATPPTRTLTAEEAARAALTRLEREHAEMSPFLHNYSTAIEPRIQELLDRNGMEGFTLDPTPAPAAGSTTPQPTGPLADALNGIKAAFTFGTRQINALRAGRTVDTTRPTGQRVLDLFEYHQRQGLTNDQALAAVAADIRRDAQSRIVQTVRNHEAQASLIGRARVSLDKLYSYLDGVARRGVQGAGASVAEAMSGRIVNDTTPFAGELVRLGLDHVWMDNEHPQHATLIRSVIHEMKTGAGTDPVAVRLAEVLRRTNEVQVGRLNANGANIRHLEGYVFSQVHNPNAIARNAAEYISDIGGWLDWEATGRAFGFDPRDLSAQRTYLSQLQYELARTDRPLPPNFNPETMGGNIANQESHRRTLYFKGTLAFDYDMKYGSGNTAGLITEQLVKRAELSTIMEHFGADYKQVWSGTMAELRRAGDWRFNKLGRIDLTFQHLVGDLNHPENARLAEIGAAARNYMNSVALWMSGVSSITDIGNAVSTMRWMGVTPGELHGRLVESMRQQALNSHADREFLLAQGAGLQSLLTAFARTQTMGGPAVQWAQRASDFTFKYNGQEIWTRTVQAAFHDLTTQHLGEMARARTLPEEFSNWLSHYGITPEEWRTMAADAARVQGLEGVRLAPDLVRDTALAQKLRTAISDSAHQAILEPSVSDRALLTLGTKAGTRYGEAVRMAMQYKAYPLAMIRRVQRRFANAYGNEGLYHMGSTAQIHWLIWAGSMISLSATVLGIKDVLRGREPLNPFDTDQWTIGNASRIISSAGVGPFAVAEQFLSPHQALGPAFGAGFDLASGVATGNGYKTTNAVIGLAPGASIIPLREAGKAALGGIFAESYGMNYQLFLRRNEQETGQSSIYQK